MRTDEEGNQCPATLGEYRDLCAALGGDDCNAVWLLDKHIAKEGRDAIVIQADSQMRLLLMPMLSGAKKDYIPTMLGNSRLAIGRIKEPKPEPIMGFKGEYRWLSNFWPGEVEFEGIKYPSTEYAYQAAKTLDLDERKVIAGLSKPGDAKKYGRKVKVREDWPAVKLSVMEQLLRLKFAIPELRQKLLDTGDVYLEETNTWSDTYFGVYKGVGENHLGKLLMKIRSEIQSSGEKS